VFPAPEPLPGLDPLALDAPAPEASEAEAAAERLALARRAEREAKQRRHATVYLWVGLLLALVGVVCAIGLVPVMITRARGAQPITTDELLALKDPNTLSSPWVTYTTDQPIVETNLGGGSKRGGSKVQTRFVLVPVRDKWMVAERAVGENGKTLEGELGKWQFGLGPEAMLKIKAEHPDKKDKILPVQLDETRGGSTGRLIFFVIAVALMILFGLGCALYGFTSSPRPSSRRWSGRRS
jgi:hypothetical protein